MTRRQTRTIAREATPHPARPNEGKTWAKRRRESEPVAADDAANDNKAWTDRGQESALSADSTASPKCELPAPVVDLRDAPIEGVAKLLAAISLPCDCERGAPDGVDCALPIDRWEREWAANL